MLPIVYNIIQQEEQQQARQLRLQRRQLRTNSEPFALPEKRFIELFRLNKNLTRNLIERLTPHLHEPIYRSGISIDIKVFTALRFYATGCYQRSIGEDYNLGLSQTAVHRAIHEVTAAIATFLTAENIVFPHTRRELQEQKALFMDRFLFPGVIGAVDGTHVAILKPIDEEHNFINRKGFHSLNVQIICDSDLKILNVNANFPGSSHYSFIWRQSRVNQFVNDLYTVNGERGFWLIGDSGYPLEPYLMTPFLNPGEDTPESRYNFRHASARNCVERCIGLLKMRFRCILKERTARYSPRFVGTLVNACSVLHNICVTNNIVLEGDDVPPRIDNEDNGVNDNNNQNQGIANLLNEGRQVRMGIVNRYFL